MATSPAAFNLLRAILHPIFLTENDAERNEPSDACECTHKENLSDQLEHLNSLRL